MVVLYVRCKSVPFVSNKRDSVVHYTCNAETTTSFIDCELRLERSHIHRRCCCIYSIECQTDQSVFIVLLLHGRVPVSKGIEGSSNAYRVLYQNDRRHGPNTAHRRVVRGQTRNSNSATSTTLLLLTPQHIIKLNSHNAVWNNRYILLQHQQIHDAI